VVGIEPSCLAALRKDAADLLPHDPRAERLGSATKTLAELLTSAEGWTPPDLSRVIGVAQPHCHHHAVLGWGNDALLLTRAGAQIRRVGGCCGLAGNFGVEEGHYEVSVKVAETALLPALAAAPGEAVVLADGYSCRTQIDDLAGVSAIHLAQLLASHL
jgi:Fe-S oxidoreductase